MSFPPRTGTLINNNVGLWLHAMFKSSNQIGLININPLGPHVSRD